MVTNSERAEAWWRAGFDDYEGPKRPSVSELLDDAERRGWEEFLASVVKAGYATKGECDDLMTELCRNREVETDGR